MEMSRLTRDGTAEPVSRDQILRHARGQGNVHFPCSADHEQDWQPYPVDPYSAICDDHTYIHTYTVDPMLLSSGNPFKCHEGVLSLQPMIPPKLSVLTFSPFVGCSEGLDAFRFVFKLLHTSQLGSIIRSVQEYTNSTLLLVVQYYNKRRIIS